MQTVACQAISGIFTWAAILVSCHHVSIISVYYCEQMMLLLTLNLLYFLNILVFVLFQNLQIFSQLD